MSRLMWCLRVAAILSLPLVRLDLQSETFRLATYNVENYLDNPVSGRPAKSEEAKAKVRQSILALKPDVLALQEIGSLNALFELRAALKSEALDLPFWQYLCAGDTNIHLALLSKFPFAATRPHTNETFLLEGHRFHVSRGFAEVDIAPGSNYFFTLIAVHLKSRRAMARADEAEFRLEEAKLLRELIDTRLSAHPDGNLVVLGDFNDSKDSASTRTVIGQGATRLVDTRPSERNGDDPEAAGLSLENRRVTWTHYFAKEDSYSRIDFLLVSKAMAREWIRSETYVLALPNWGLASDHRPLVATFEASDR